MLLTLLSLAAQPMPTGADLVGEIEKVDAALFWNAFEGCNPQAVGDLLGDNFRMVHDQAGLAVPTREAFVASLEEQCSARSQTGYKNRRLLTPRITARAATRRLGCARRGPSPILRMAGRQLDHGAAPAYPPEGE